MREKFNVRVQVSVEKDGSYNGERLSVNQEFSVGANDFMEICRILGQFQTLADKIKAEKTFGA